MAAAALGSGSPRSKKLEAVPVKRLGIFHLRPVAAILHLEDPRVGDELNDDSRGIQEHVTVVDRGDDQCRSPQPHPVLIRYPVAVVNVGIQQRQDVRHCCFHVGAAVDRKTRRDQVVPDFAGIVKQSLEDFDDALPGWVGRGR